MGSAKRNNIIRLEKSVHRLIEPGIIEMQVVEGEFFELGDAELSHRAHLELSAGEKFCILLDTQNGYFNVSPEAKKKIASAEYARHMNASALVVASMAARLTGNFFMRLMLPVAPTRLFTSREDALTWLRKFTTEPAGSEKSLLLAGDPE